MKTKLQAQIEYNALCEDLNRLTNAGFADDHHLVKSVLKDAENLVNLYMKPSPFKVFETYRLMDGNSVSIKAVWNEGNSYETIEDEFEHHRYSTRDFGRVTGSKSRDFQRNIDLRTVDMTDFEAPVWWQWFERYGSDEVVMVRTMKGYYIYRLPDGTYEAQWNEVPAYSGESEEHVILQILKINS